MRLAANGEAINTELQFRCDLFQGNLGTLSAGKAIGKDADRMATLGLTCGKIENMPENAADRCTDSVQDAKRRVGRLGHCQNQRSATTTVSPGFRSVPGGTTA